MIPPHTEPWLDDATGVIYRAPCWCGPSTFFVRDTTDESRVYAYPNTWHDGNWIFHSFATDGVPPV